MGGQLGKNWMTQAKARFGLVPGPPGRFGQQMTRTRFGKEKRSRKPTLRVISGRKSKER